MNGAAAQNDKGKMRGFLDYVPQGGTSLGMTAPLIRVRKRVRGNSSRGESFFFDAGEGVGAFGDERHVCALRQAVDGRPESLQGDGLDSAAGYPSIPVRARLYNEGITGRG